MGICMCVFVCHMIIPGLLVLHSLESSVLLPYIKITFLNLFQLNSVSEIQGSIYMCFLIYAVLTLGAVYCECQILHKGESELINYIKSYSICFEKLVIQ